MIKIGSKVTFTGWKTDIPNDLINLPIGTELIVNRVYQHCETIECDIFEHENYMLFENEYKVKENNMLWDHKHSLKVKDKVVCMDSSNMQDLEKGKIYTVYSVDGSFLKLEGIHVPYGAYRFKLYVPPPTYRICIRNDNHPDRTEILLETSSKALSEDIVLNLATIFNKLDYKTFKVFSKKEGEL